MADAVQSMQDLIARLRAENEQLRQQQPPSSDQASAADMDDFVRDLLKEWGFEELIGTFAEHKVNKESFLCFEEQDFKELIPEMGLFVLFRQKLRKFKEEQAEENHAQASTSEAPSANAMPSRGSKRKQDDSEPGPNKRQKRMELDRKLKKVTKIMSRVQKKLPENNDVLIAYLRELIINLKTDKKEVVGVFGKTGAGKSSLINAVIEEENLLPSGFGRACTSVIIKVEGSDNQKYTAIVEFISVQELEDLVESTRHLFGNSSGNVDDESKESSEKMDALFGTDWKKESYESFMKSKNYRKISNAIRNTKVFIDSPSALSEQLRKYTQNVRDPSSTWFWPVVKCVTIKVPNNDLLRHVTLVDLPGTGDRNKTRNDMWKEMVSSCGTVWIVSDMNRYESEDEPWNILKRACSLLGNGGECRKIHFICTKADLLQGQFSPDTVKEDICHGFMNLPEVNNHFPQNCFQVFIVSATKENMPGNEISDLDEFLESLNDPEELVQRFVSDAFAILALMKGARSQNAHQKHDLHRSLNDKRGKELLKIEDQMRVAYESLESHLTEGVSKAKQHWETALDEKIGSVNNYKKLKSILLNGGVQQTKTGDQINLNTTLSSFLTKSIDKEFRKTFPNAGKDGPFYGAVYAFSLNIESLTKNNEDVKLLLKFLKREEEKLMEKLREDIRQSKKQIYNSLTDTVTRAMFAAYREAAGKSGQGALERMKQTLKDHVQRNNMFDKAKEEMLKQLNELREHITKVILEDLTKAMDMALKRDVTSVPDVTQEFTDVGRLHADIQSGH